MIISNVLNHPNQFSFEDNGKRVFQSYNSICAIVENGIIRLGRNWNYSRTTLKHLKAFLNWSNYSKKDIEKMLKQKDSKIIYDDSLI